MSGAHVRVTLRRRLARAGASGALAATALAAAVVTTIAPAQGLPAGTPFTCNPSLYFQSIGNPTQLYEEVYNASGGITYTAIGPNSGVSYNAIGYDTLNNFIYGAESNGDLVQIDSTGAVAPTGIVLPAAFISAGMDFSGNYYGQTPDATGSPGQEEIYEVNIASGAVTQTPLTLSTGGSYTTGLTDWTFGDGFFWSFDASTGDIVRINPSTGVVLEIPQTFIPNTGTYGAAWTFGNGNLVFSNNNSGEVYQLAVTNPTGASPTVSGVSSALGRTASTNDGTSCQGPPVDLSISKTGPASVAVGASVSWTVTVTDVSGVNDSSGYTVTDDVPPGFTNVATATTGCSVSGNDVTCVEPEINAGQSFPITITATAPAAPSNGAYTNAATVTGNEADPNPSNNTATATTVVGFANVSVGKTASNATPNVGAADSFALTALNGVSSTADSGQIVVTDTVPSVMPITSVVSTSCPATSSCSFTLSGQTVMWTISNLVPGADAVLTINVTVNTSSQTSNIASFTQTTPSSTGATSGSSNRANIVPQYAVVSLVKSISAGNSEVGTNDTFLLTASNGASSPAASGQVVVIDPLPAGLTYVSSSASTGTVGVSGQTVTWTIANLAAGASATLQIVVTVNTANAVDNTATFTQVEVNATGGTTGSSNTVVLTPVYANVSVSKSATTTIPDVGTEDTFQLVALDSGTTAAGAVTVTDTLPAGLTYVSSSASNGSTVSVSGQTVTWTIANLGVGAGNEATLSITVLVTATAAVSNTASFTQTVPSSTGATSGSSNSVTLTPQFADVTVDKTVASATPTVGSQDTFTLTAANDASSSASSGQVVVTDVLPAGLTFVSSAPVSGGGTVSVSGQTVTWTIPTLAPGASAAIQIVVTVTSDAATQNTATFTQTIPNSTGGTSGSSPTVTVTPAFAAVTVQKTVSSATPDVGTQDTFTLTAANDPFSTADSGQVVVTDVLPAGLTYVSSTASAGIVGDTGQTVTWTIPDIAPDNSDTLQIVVTVNTSAQVTNTATFTQETPNGTGGTTGSSNSVTLTSQFADVTVTKSASSTVAQLGSDDTFTITASNAGPAAAGQVVVTDVLASGLSYRSSSPSVGTVSVSGQTVTWTIPMLGPPGNGNTATLKIVVLVDTTSTVGNSVTFTQSTPNGSGATSGKSGTVTVVPAYGVLKMTKTISTATPTVGTDGTYTVVVTNTGPDTARQVAVVDSLPSGESFVSASTTVGSASESMVNGVETVVCTVGTLAVDASATMTLTVRFTAAGTVVNVAEATDSTFNRSSGGQVLQAAASAIVVPPGVVPPTHTGEPWSGWLYWLLVGLLGAGGAVMLENARRRRRRVGAAVR